MEYEFSLPSSVRGYHIYQEIWKPTIGEELTCTREPRNAVDRYAVAVVKENGRERTVVGHLPGKISKISSLFLRRGGAIICQVTGTRRYSTDLVQGGLEIPCILVFKSNNKKEADKTAQCMSSHFKSR